MLSLGPAMKWTMSRDLLNKCFPSMSPLFSVHVPTIIFLTFVNYKKYCNICELVTVQDSNKSKSALSETVLSHLFVFLLSLPLPPPLSPSPLFLYVMLSDCCPAFTWYINAFLKCSPNTLDHVKQGKQSCLFEIL